MSRQPGMLAASLVQDQAPRSTGMLKWVGVGFEYVPAARYVSCLPRPRPSPFKPCSVHYMWVSHVVYVSSTHSHVSSTHHLGYEPTNSQQAQPFFQSGPLRSELKQSDNRKIEQKPATMSPVAGMKPSTAHFSPSFLCGVCARHFSPCTHHPTPVVLPVREAFDVGVVGDWQAVLNVFRPRLSESWYLTHVFHAPPPQFGPP